MLLERNITSGLIWGICPIDRTSEELLELLENNVYYFSKIKELKNEQRRREWLTVRLLLRELLGREIEILYTDTGKPYLADNSFNISISHTSGFVAIALSKEKVPGIDIEYISSRILKIKDRFMSGEEKNNLFMPQELVHLLLHWSAKESMFKVLDVENVIFDACLHIKPFIPLLNKLSSFSAYETRTEKNHSFLINYIVKPEYVLTFTGLEEKVT